MAASEVLAPTPEKQVGFLATSSCTGYMIPGIDVEVAECKDRYLDLPP